MTPKERMTLREFKYGLLELADPNDKRFISERVIARRLAALYIEADEDTQRDCSAMLRDDLAAIMEEQTDATPIR